MNTTLKDTIRKQVEELYESQLRISAKHIEGILKNTTKKSDQDILNSFLSKKDALGFVKMSEKQYQLFKNIKKGAN